jgi:hypothetical protein
MTSIRRCENCKWWEPMEDNLGFCHFNPPVVVEGDVPPWPMTVEDDWCKECTPKDDG